jgi:glyceraldehyde 3-phosphate dehydrogenase
MWATTSEMDWGQYKKSNTRPVRVGINGLGYIGRRVLTSIFEQKSNEIQIVAVNDITDLQISAHLLRYNSNHGSFNGTIATEKNNLIVNGQKILYTQIKDPSNLYWGEDEVDIVLECTGMFTKRDAAEGHIKSGARKVLISAPSMDADRTVVFGVNEGTLKPSDIIVSNASCTTNCAAVMLKPISDGIGIKHASLTTTHAATSDVRVVDLPHSDMRRCFGASVNLIPTTTGAGKATTLVLPELTGKIDARARYAPITNASLLDFEIITERPTSLEEVVNLIENFSLNHPDIVAITRDQVASSVFQSDTHSAVLDVLETKVTMGGEKILLSAWYDNEAGFSRRMEDTTRKMHAVGYDPQPAQP